MYRLILIWLVILDVLGMVFCLVGWLNYSALRTSWCQRSSCWRSRS